MPTSEPNSTTNPAAPSLPRMSGETRGVVLRVLNLDHHDHARAAHGGVLTSVVQNAILDLKTLRAVVDFTDDRALTEVELSEVVESLIGRLEAGLDLSIEMRNEEREAQS